MVFTPIADVWYTFLAARFGRPVLSHTFAKVALDQTVFAPCILSTLYIYTALTERKSVSDGVERAKANIWPTLKANWMFWPAVQGINLGLVPPQFQLLVVNCASIPWNTYLASQTAKATQKDLAARAT